MKKLFSMLLLVATTLFVSCEAVEEILDKYLNDGDEITYVGAMDVSASGVTMYSSDSTEFTLEKDDNTVSILMSQMKFSEAMPVTLDIQVSDIAATDNTFSADSVIPTVSSIPMDSYEITNISGTYDTESLTMTFECYGCTVTYTGSAQ